MRRYVFAIILPLALNSCAKDDSMSHLSDLNSVKAKLAFSCTHEANSLPPLDPQADQVFKYARYLEKQRGEKDYNDIARYYRIAAAHEHYKANHNLQQLVSEGWADSPYPQRESIELATQLVDQGIPIGYYDIGYYLNLGYGFKQDKEMALRYFRKAADLGDADAQYYIADKLSPWNMAPDIANQMYKCAMAQGHSKAADDWGIALSVDKKFAEAVEAFQKGVAAGGPLSALALQEAFSGVKPDNELYYLGLPYDAERSHRYYLIGKFIDRNDGRNPKVPDIDQIVPLPPATLPEWDGSFQWEKEQAHVPPKPSEELIKRLCKDKNLDPATGLPLPLPPKTALGTRAKTGERCPETGMWCPLSRDGTPMRYATERLHKGKTMPTYAQRLWRWPAFLDAVLPPRYDELHVEWQLVDYA